MIHEITSCSSVGVSTKEEICVGKSDFLNDDPLCLLSNKFCPILTKKVFMSFTGPVGFEEESKSRAGLLDFLEWVICLIVFQSVLLLLAAALSLFLS